MSFRSVFVSLLIALPFLGLEMSPLVGTWAASYIIWGIFVLAMVVYHFKTIIKTITRLRLQSPLTLRMTSHVESGLDVEGKSTETRDVTKPHESQQSQVIDPVTTLALHQLQAASEKLAKNTRGSNQNSLWTIADSVQKALPTASERYPDVRQLFQLLIRIGEKLFDETGEYNRQLQALRPEPDLQINLLLSQFGTLLTDYMWAVSQVLTIAKHLPHHDPVDGAFSRDAIWQYGDLRDRVNALVDEYNNLMEMSVQLTRTAWKYEGTLPKETDLSKLELPFRQ